MKTNDAAVSLVKLNDTHHLEDIITEWYRGNIVARSKNTVSLLLGLNANSCVVLPRHSPTMPRHHALLFTFIPRQ
jgi:hypothetical protein